MTPNYNRCSFPSDFPSPTEMAEGERSDLLFAYGMFFARSMGHRMPGWAATCARGAFAGIVAVATATMRAEVDLTPTPSVYEIDGARFANVTFRDGLDKVTYTPPTGWRLQGGRGRLSLVPADFAQAEGTITVEAAAPKSAAGERTAQEWADTLVQRLPREITAREVLEAVPNPLKISGFDTFVVTLRYQLYGQVFRSQTILMPVGAVLWRFEFTARDHQFDRAYEPYRISLYSLQGIAARGR